MLLHWALRDGRVPICVTVTDYLTCVLNVDMYRSLVNPKCSRVSRLISVHSILYPPCLPQSATRTRRLQRYDGQIVYLPGRPSLLGIVNLALEPKRLSSISCWKRAYKRHLQGRIDEGSAGLQLCEPKIQIDGCPFLQVPYVNYSISAVLLILRSCTLWAVGLISSRI